MPRNDQKSRDSYAPVVVSLAIEAPPLGGMPAGRRALFAPDRLMSFNLTQNLGGMMVGTMTLRETSDDFLTGMAIVAGRTQFYLKWGRQYSDTVDSFENAIEYCVTVTKATVDFGQSSLTWELEVCGDPVATRAEATMTDRAPRSFAEGLLPPQLAAIIATANGFKSRSDPRYWIGDAYYFGSGAGGRASSAERTAYNNAQKLPAMTIPEGMSDFAFLRDVIAPRAWSHGLIKDSSGNFVPVRTKDASDFVRFPYRCYFDNSGSLHFHTAHPAENPNLPGVNATVGQVTRVYRVYADDSGEVIEFGAEDNSLFVAMSGGGEAYYTSFDAVTGKPIEKKAERGKGVGGNNGSMRITYSSECTMRSRANEVNNPVYRSVLGRTEAESELLARAYNNSLRNAAYAATIKVHGTHQIVAGGSIIVERYDQKGIRHYLSGWFNVIEVTHEYDGGWRTAAKLTRAGMAEGEVEEDAAAIHPSVPGEDAEDK